MWINDLGMSDYKPELGSLGVGVPEFTMSHTDATDLVQGWRQLLARCHNSGIRVLAGTTIPFKGAFYWSPEKDRQRRLLNEWIRTSGEPDGFVDFDAALRDPEDDAQMAESYHVGDFLHPSASGSQAMAESIDLDMC